MEGDAEHRTAAKGAGGAGAGQQGVFCVLCAFRRMQIVSLVVGVAVSVLGFWGEGSGLVFFYILCFLWVCFCS